MLDAIDRMGHAARSVPERLAEVAPGLGVAVVLAVTARFLSEHYGAPAMLMALLLGIAFHFLAEEGRCVAGVECGALMVLRIGVALLGARISIEMLIALGWPLVLLVASGVVATIGFALAASRLLGRGWRLGLLTGGAVAICGASAAMAIAATLPRGPNSERDLIFTVLGVTLLSTAAMILYPVIAETVGLGSLATGVFIGASIHDVAQVVGAGFSVSEPVGETATLVKLIRVSMLAPVVLIFALAVRLSRRDGAPQGERPPLVPAFVMAFLLLVALNSLHLLPEALAGAMRDLSGWALLVAVAAVGMKTSLRSMFAVGGHAAALIVAESAFICVFVLVGLAWLIPS
jgi:uncharacterized integral membrane protein (TIGR00698 family)